MTIPSEAFDPAGYFNQDVAARYDEGIRLSCPSYDALHHMIAPWFQLLPPDSRFLSAGAGTGAEIITLAERFAGWHFAGVDASADMIEECRRRVERAGHAHRVSLVHGRLEDYRPDAPFDAAAAIFVSHFMKGREARLAFLRAVAANLKPGGVFVLADLFGDRRAPEFVHLMRGWMLSYIAHGVTDEKLTQDVAHVLKNVDFLPEAELLGLLTEAGFTEPLRFYQSYVFGGWVATRA